jgi:hypothetical protein
MPVLGKLARNSPRAAERNCDNGLQRSLRLLRQACYNAPIILSSPVIGVVIQGSALAHSLSIRLLLSVVCLLAGGVSAGQKVDIYKADVLVKNQGESERNAAARASFGELVVRVSGQRSALDHPVIRQALPRAQNYLFGFTYKSTAEKITEGDKSFPALALELTYEPRAIDQLLREARLPLWPAVRPKVLVWLVYKDATGLHQVPQVDLQAMKAQAAYRGLPLAYPKLDLEDSLSLAADDLWAVDLAKIKTASLRYKVDAVLVGRYAPTNLGPIPTPITMEEATAPDAAPSANDEPTLMNASDPAAVSVTAETAENNAPVLGPWVGDWQLIHGDNQQTFADETPEVAGLFASAIDRTADYFANQYAITPTDQGAKPIVLRVGNITSFGAFKQVQRYLDELAMVQRTEVIAVNAEGLLVRLMTEGDVKLLMSTLALGRRLAPLQSQSQTAAGVQVAVPGELTPPEAQVSAPEGIDAEAMAELEQALASEQMPGVNRDAIAAPANIGAINAGTLEDPLIYVWQK